MSNEPTEAEGLTDEEISPDQDAGSLGSSGEATDPDIRNTTAEQDDPVDQSDPLQELGSVDEDGDEAEGTARTSPTD